jgi:hypothetical protein
MAEFTVDDVTYQMVSLDDIEQLTLGELEIIEEVGQTSLAEFAEGNIGSKAMIALVLVAMRRVDPAATVEMARKAKVGDLAKIGDDAVPPSAPAVVGLP